MDYKIILKSRIVLVFIFNVTTPLCGSRIGTPSLEKKNQCNMNGNHLINILRIFCSFVVPLSSNLSLDQIANDDELR